MSGVRPPAQVDQPIRQPSQSLVGASQTARPDAKAEAKFESKGEAKARVAPAEDFSAPKAVDYDGNFISTLATAVALAALAHVIGACLKSVYIRNGLLRRVGFGEAAPSSGADGSGSQ